MAPKTGDYNVKAQLEETLHHQKVQRLIISWIHDDVSKHYIDYCNRLQQAIVADPTPLQLIQRMVLADACATSEDVLRSLFDCILRLDVSIQELKALIGGM